MPVIRNKYNKAYSRAVIAELQRRGQDPDQALRIFHHYYGPLYKTWGMELNAEAFADEMLRVKRLSDTMPDRKINTTSAYSKKSEKMGMDVSKVVPGAKRAGRWNGLPILVPVHANSKSESTAKADFK
jgi:hypothetical protein